MADEMVKIVDYDPEWADRFVEQRDRLTSVLARWLARPVEHVGSTSVPGLPAKPVVDVLAPVWSLPGAEEAVTVLEREGWLFWPDDPCRSYRLWFLRPRPEARTHHLYLIEHDHFRVRELLAFRDALRGESGLVKEYASLKGRLAREHRENRNAYTNAKTDFVEWVLRRAGVEPQPRRRLPE